MTMEKLKKCRICLVENVLMYTVANKNLQEIYEKLTNVPFVTEDIRPILACFFCCSKLKQSYQLQKKCLEAEQLFAQMLNNDYETKPIINQGLFEIFGGFNITPTMHISIVDKCQTERMAIKEELTADCEGLHIIEPKQEYHSDELKPELFANSCLDVAEIPPYHSESDLEDDVPLMELKIEIDDEQETPKKKVIATETKSATVAKKPKLEDAITAEEIKKENRKSDAKVRTTQKRTSKHGTYLKEPSTCDERSLKPGGDLTKHIIKQTGEKPYKCDVCQRIFSAKCSLLRHTRLHTGEKPFKCDICQRSFSDKGHLSKHIRVHTGEKPYKCDVCQCCFRQNGHLAEHIRQHSGEKPYKCDVCQRSFSVKSSLLRHIRIHTGEKPFKCDLCQRSFSEHSVLTNHIRIHTGEKPFKCKICQCSFRQNVHLKEHIRQHSGEKPYKCDVCQRSFSQKGHLTKHIRVHTGEKPYKCDICQRRFSQRGNLTEHIRIHAGEKPFN